MKRSLLFLLGAFSVASISAQNILDEKVTFKYTQLPLVKLDGTKEYSVQVEANVAQRNADSTAAYEQRKIAYANQLDACMDLWEQDKKRIDKAYLAAMVQWEQQVAAGNTAAVAPVKQPYPPINCPGRPKKPFLLQEVQTSSIIAGINIQGMTQNSSAAVKITLVFEGFEKGMMKMETKGTAPAQTYFWTMQYRSPVTLKIEMPGKGLVVNERIPDLEGFRTHRTKEYKSKSEFELWWMDNEEGFWNERQSQAVMDNVSAINSYLTNKFGYPVVGRAVEVYSVKTNKDFDYSDMQNAYTAMESGLLNLAYPEKINDAQNEINKAIGIWTTVLKESNVNDKKARVDKNVTAAAYINLSEAYIWLNDFAQAEVMANKAINVGVNKYEKDGKAKIAFIRDMKTRYNANK
ncbi:MAG: hypothetical protein ACOZCO_06180 [Bacteroidota bacterium]